jgi:hypothetical protein
MAASTYAEAEALLAAANCDICYMSPGSVWYAIIAALIHIENGEPVPDAQTLISEIGCLECVISPGMIPYAILQALRGISTGGGVGGSVACGAGAPVAAPSGTCALYIDTNTGALYSYYSGAWH